MADRNEFTFSSGDGVHQLWARQWLPAGAPKAVVQLVHGVAEHIDRYDDFARFLAEHGYAAVGCDHLGHGKSIGDDSELGWFSEEPGWKYLAGDQKKLHDLLSERFPGVPMVLFGHSMGSFVARTYLGWYPGDFDACVLSGTGHTPRPVCRLGRAMAAREIRAKGSKYRSATLQKMAFGGYLKKIKDPIGANDWICRDEAVIRKYDADPLCGFTATAGLMRDMLEGLQLIAGPEHMAKMEKTKPILFISGDADPVGGYGKGVGKVAAMFKSAGMHDVTVKLYPKYRHEVLNEFGREQVWQDVLDWMEKKI